ncbi:MAG TPA: hypothetical protein VFF09_01270 [archaeon]|nr:hypothetical protein [archaeon]
MYQKTVEKARAYSEADIAKLRKISRSIKESKKNADYRRAIEEFIKATT